MNDPGGGDVFKPNPDCRRIPEIKFFHGDQSVKRPVRFDHGQVGGENALGSLERPPDGAPPRLAEKPGQDGAAFRIESHRSPRVQSSAS